MNRSDWDQLTKIAAKRYECLQVLSNSSRRKRDIVDKLDCSRSTVDRAIRDLREVSLITRDDGMWQLTFYGQCVYMARSRYFEHLQTLHDAAPLLENLSPPTFLERTFLDAADVYVSESSAPDAVINVFLDHINRSTTVRVVTPVVLLGFVDEFIHSVSDSKDYKLELITSENVLDRVSTYRPDLLSDFADDPNLSCYCTNIPFDVAFWIGDHEHVGIIVFTEQGVSGIIVIDTDEALDQATDQFNQMKDHTESASVTENLPSH